MKTYSERKKRILIEKNIERSQGGRGIQIGP